MKAVIFVLLVCGTFLVAWLLIHFTVFSLAAWGGVAPVLAWHMGRERGWDDNG